MDFCASLTVLVSSPSCVHQAIDQSHRDPDASDGSYLGHRAVRGVSSSGLLYLLHRLHRVEHSAGLWTHLIW